MFQNFVLLGTGLQSNLIQIQHRRTKAPNILLDYNSGGYTFALAHSGYLSCGIPDGDTYVLTGGGKHNFVTRSLANCHY